MVDAIPDAPPLDDPIPVAPGNVPVFQPAAARAAANGKPIRAEERPKVDSVRIGIEVEGVGTITTQWRNPQIIQQQNFHDVFKRMKLVRSNSFSTERGVYITPEDSGRMFGRSGPAELVSSPHKLDGQSLLALRNSVWKSLGAKGMRTGSDTFRDLRPQPANAALAQRQQAFQGAVATSRWGVHKVASISGSLQVTVGVAVEKLLSDDQATRDAVVKLLVGDEGKRLLVGVLLKTAVLAEGWLTAADRPLSGYPDYKFGIRLALLMALISPMTDLIGVVGGRWGKDRLGCNFKGTSSFVACNIGIGNRFLDLKRREWHYPWADLRRALVNGIAVGLGAQGLTDYLLNHWDVRKIGQPGNSVQTDVEGWYSLPNFLNNGHLYTIVEVREKAASLNVQMANYLNKLKEPITQPANGERNMKVKEKWNKAKADAEAFCRGIRAILAF
jgi:hypothetical protein